MCQVIENNIFDTIEEAIFWSVRLLKIKEDGASISSKGLIPRPFEPIDIMLPFWRLIRSGTLEPASENIVMKYGYEGVEPLKSNIRDYNLWRTSLLYLEPILINKKIIRKKRGR